jgi:hypothetical protein
MAVTTRNSVMEMETSKLPQPHRYGTRFAAESIAKYGIDPPFQRQPPNKPKNNSHVITVSIHGVESMTMNNT